LGIGGDGLESGVGGGRSRGCVVGGPKVFETEEGLLGESFMDGQIFKLKVDWGTSRDGVGAEGGVEARGDECRVRFSGGGGGGGGLWEVGRLGGEGSKCIEIRGGEGWLVECEWRERSKEQFSVFGDSGWIR